jgi:hypothetical protein
MSNYDDLIKRLQPYYNDLPVEGMNALDELVNAVRDLQAQNIRLLAFVEWVDTIVSNPVSLYSVHALDGLFGMTRDKIAALSGDVRKSYYCEFCDKEHMLHEDALGFHHIIKGERVACSSAYSKDES